MASAPPPWEDFQGDTSTASPSDPSQLPLEQRNAMLQEYIRHPDTKASDALNYAAHLGLRITSHMDENVGKPTGRVANSGERPPWEDFHEAPPAPPAPPPDTSFGHDTAVAVHGAASGVFDLGSALKPAFNTVLPFLGDAGEYLTSSGQHAIDATGFGTPETSGQNYIHAAARGITSAGPFAAEAAPLRAAATLTSGVTSSLSSEAARQAGLGRGAQLAAGVAGGIAGGGPIVAFDRPSAAALPDIAEGAVPPMPRGPIASLRRLTGRDTTTGAHLVAQRLADDGINPHDAGRVMAEAQANGTPLALADMGENTRALAGSVSRQPGPARTIGKQFTKERQMGQMDRVRDAINRDLGPTTDVYEESARLMDQAKTDAAPIYQEALTGGSVAPLESQFKDAFQRSSAEVSSARGAVADAQRRSTQAAADLSRGDSNVYGASAGLRAQREAKAALDQAQSNLSAAQTAHEANMGRLRQAQADGSANAPGAVWSPRIQQFLDDPITKAGLAKGLEVQRLESLATGKSFNPTEYAITGTDKAGNPTVASVPNMRTLDAVKRGFDELLNAYPRSVTGKLMLDQRGRAIDMARKSFINEVDRINPTYADARAAYAGPVQLRDAMEDGKRALNKSASEINQRIKNMTPAEADQYGLGLRSAIADAMERSPDGANKVRALVGDPRRRAVLQTVFGGKANLDRFVSTMENEQSAFETHQVVNSGSPTATRLAEDHANSDINLVKGVGSDLAAVGGGPVTIGLRALERGGDLLRFGAGKAGQRAREDAASLLFSTSSGEFKDALGKISLQARRNLYRRQGLFPVTGAAAAASQYGKDKP